VNVIFEKTVEKIMGHVDTIKRTNVENLLGAYHFAINLPKGQVPKSGEQFYDPEFATNADKNKTPEPKVEYAVEGQAIISNISDGSSADYYKLPPNATQLQDLISYKNLNSQLGEIMRAVYRYGQVSHSAKMRDAKKIQFYINEEIKRLENYESIN